MHNVPFTRFDRLAFLTVFLTVSVFVSPIAAGGIAVRPDTAVPSPALAVMLRHLESFTRGDNGKAYTIAVHNAGAPTSGAVTVTDTLPAGLTAAAMSGPGWTCDLATVSCTRSDSLASGATWPVITLSVNVAANAAFHVVNTASVSGGGDFVTTNNSASDPTVIHAAGTCALFAPKVDYPVGGASQGIGSADFNGDGKTDLAFSVANSNSANPGSVSIVLSKGDGTFLSPVLYTIGLQPRGLIVGDFNGDALPDLAIANSASDTVSVLLGNGDGTFAAATDAAAGSAPNSVLVSDFNGDGRSDLAVGSPTSSNAALMLGNGDGTFAPPVAVPVNGPLAVGDFNGDGNSDLVDISQTNFSISIRYGSGTGTFGAAVSYQVDVTPTAVAVGDFNGDGRPDLAISSTNVIVAFLLGEPGGISGNVRRYYLSSHAGQILVGDYDGDGKSDLSMLDGSSLTIIRGNGDGNFLRHIYYHTPGFGRIATGDFNGDGIADLAGSDGATVSVVLGGCPDFQVTKTHTGDFKAGQRGARYTITVSNIGAVYGTYPVNVTDHLPAGLTATNASGVGWDCHVEVLCRAGYSLAPHSTFPPITVTVDVAPNAPALVTNTASVEGPGDASLTNNTASDPTTIVPQPDLVIVKTHFGNFAQGQKGRTYSIVVTNGGDAPTSGTVTVIDGVPAGLTPVSMTGDGWTCDLASRTCTRTDVLASKASYPPISFAVNVNDDAPFNIVNTASVSGGGETYTPNSTTSDPTRVVTKANNLKAIAISPSQVYLTWDGSIWATNFQVHRSSHNGSFTIVGLPVTGNFTDTNLTADTTYLYFVRATDSANVAPPSNTDLATTILFTDDPLEPGYSIIKAVHLTELRTAVNAARAAAGMPPASFTDDLTAATWIQTVHIAELRASLDAARSARGLPAISYTDPSLQAGTVMKAAHIREIRAGVK